MTLINLLRFAAHGLRTLDEKLDIIIQILRSPHPGPRKIASVKFDVPRYSPKTLPSTGAPNNMPASLTLPNDEQVVVGLTFKDAVAATHAPADGGSVASSDPAVATATLASTDDSVTIVAMSDGTTTITYTNGTLSDTLTVTVAEPTPTSVAFDPTTAVFTPKTP